MNNLFTFVSGSIFGAYIAQNYDIPNISNLTKVFVDYLKSIEKK
tara:strand:+ start:658 stop:789 length:132 start_codon:yes stop_codon:yes gene_type:complete